MVAQLKISKKKKSKCSKFASHGPSTFIIVLFCSTGCVGPSNTRGFRPNVSVVCVEKFSLLDRFILFSACSSFFRNGVSFPRVSVRPLSLISWACKDRPGVIKLLDRTRRFVSLVFLATSLSRASIFCFRIFLLCSVLLSFFTHMGFFSQASFMR